MEKERVDAHWKLRRRQAQLHAEFEFLHREVASLAASLFTSVQCVQLCEKRFLKPPVDSIDLLENEKKLLADIQARKLREVVTKQCSATIRFLMSQKVCTFRDPLSLPLAVVLPFQ